MSLVRIGQEIRKGFARDGVRYALTLTRTATTWVLRRLLRPSFVFQGKQLRYFVHPFLLNNERAVEVALAVDFLRGRDSGSVLELGNVLMHYVPTSHTVVDKYEVAPGVINEDIVTFAPGRKFATIVTISTLEHVGWDEEPREADKVARAIARLKELLAEGGELFATVPVGHNDFLDRMIRDRATGFSEVRYLRRISASNRWREATLEEAVSARYNEPYHAANAIAVGFFRR